MSNSSISKVAEFLLWLWEVKNLSVSSMKEHHSMLSAVFKFKLPELGDHLVLRDLIRSFCIEHPHRLPTPPCWDLDIALSQLMSEAYELLSSLSLRSLTKKTLFLVALATAKRVGDLQALSKVISSQGNDMILSYLPHFIAKTERADAPLPRSFHLCSLAEFAGDLEAEFAGDLEEGSLLCPVRALRTYLERTKLFPLCASTLFCSPCSPSRAMLKNAVLYFLREVISGAGAIRGDEGPPLRAHSIRGVSTSAVFLKNWSIS